MITRQFKLIFFRGLLLPTIVMVFIIGNLFSEIKNNEHRILTLNQIIEKVLKQNKNLIANKWSILAKDGDIIQASLKLNPEIEVEFGNFAGSGESRGFDQAEASVQIGQTILLKGKQKKKVKLAKLNKIIFKRDYERKLSELFKETKKRFIILLHIQEKFILREEMVNLAEKFLKKISVRVIAGRTSPVELSRARVSLLRNKLSLKRLEKEMFISQQNLTLMWSKTKPDFDKVKGSLGIDPVIPGLDKFKNLISFNTDLKLLKSEIDYYRSQLILQKAFRMPDPTFHGGIKRMNESKNTAFTFSFSIPIPLYNRNQGSIKTAEYLLKKSEYEYKAAEIKIENDLISTYEMLQNAYNTSLTIKNRILPEAQEAYTAINRGYDLGKFGYLDVFDTYKTLLEVKEEYLECLAEYWFVMADIEQISGIEMGKLVKNIKKEKNNEK